MQKGSVDAAKSFMTWIFNFTLLQLQSVKQSNILCYSLPINSRRLAPENIVIVAGINELKSP